MFRPPPVIASGIALGLLLSPVGHRPRSARSWQPALVPLLAGSRRGLPLLSPEVLLAPLRRAQVLLRTLAHRRSPLWFPPPATPPGALSNWRRRRRRPLPSALVLLVPQLNPLGREGGCLGLPVLAPSPPGWVTHPLPPVPPPALLRLLAGGLLRHRSEVAQW